MFCLIAYLRSPNKAEVGNCLCGVCPGLSGYVVNNSSVPAQKVNTTDQVVQLRGRPRTPVRASRDLSCRYPGVSAQTRQQQVALQTVPSGVSCVPFIIVSIARRPILQKQYMVTDSTVGDSSSLLLC